VDRRVLIPRPETEILTGLADEFLKRRPGILFADWCTGSGCIAVTLLADNPGCTAYAVDSSADALEVAGRNAGKHSVSDRITFALCSDPAATDFIALESLDLIVANPPYIPKETMETLEAQVRDHEPREALDGGSGGLDVFRALLSGLPRLMKDGAPLLMETGGGLQIDELKTLAKKITKELSFENVFEDHREIARFMLWRKVT